MRLSYFFIIAVSIIVYITDTKAMKTLKFGTPDIYFIGRSAKTTEGVIETCYAARVFTSEGEYFVSGGKWMGLDMEKKKWVQIMCCRWDQKNSDSIAEEIDPGHFELLETEYNRRKSITKPKMD